MYFCLFNNLMTFSKEQGYGKDYSTITTESVEVLISTGLKGLSNVTCEKSEVTCFAIEF